MIAPLERCWSFAYSLDGALYSVDVLALSQDEAVAKVAAMANASFEGEISRSPLDALPEASAPSAYAFAPSLGRR